MDLGLNLKKLGQLLGNGLKLRRNDLESGASPMG